MLIKINRPKRWMFRKNSFKIRFFLMYAYLCRRSLKESVVRDADPTRRSLNSEQTLVSWFYLRQLTKERPKMYNQPIRSWTGTNHVTVVMSTEAACDGNGDRRGKLWKWKQYGVNTLKRGDLVTDNDEQTRAHKVTMPLQNWKK